MKLTIFLIALVVANELLNKGFTTLSGILIVVAAWEALGQEAWNHWRTKARRADAETHDSRANH